MRLINTTTLELHEFVDASSAPRYAILSHRWGDEVSYKDYCKGRKRDSSGYAKIVQSCVVARNDGHDWIWVDTCCIDKRSSAELSEAINSMFSYYARSRICYAYLADVLTPRDEISERRDLHELLRTSSWFTRGWTLQELIAPKVVVFLDQQWKTMGAKYATSLPLPPGDRIHSSPPVWLNDMISNITGIPETVLQSREAMYHHSVAQRFSWAANRRTTRIEDMAYCLLGLFDIKLPLLYGEGRESFTRLQKEILTSFEDDSIFAWSPLDGQAARDGRSCDFGMLARLPAEFAQSTYITKYHAHTRPPYALTNRGLEIRVQHASLGAGAYRSADIPNLACLELNCGQATISQYPHSSCAMYLDLLDCGHYGRAALLLHFAEPAFMRDDGHWTRFREDEVLFDIDKTASAVMFGYGKISNAPDSHVARRGFVAANEILKKV